MIQLKDKTTIALLIIVARQNYGRAWYSRENTHINLGISSPAGPVLYKLPLEYGEYLKGMVEITGLNGDDASTGEEATDRLLEWSKTL